MTEVWGEEEGREFDLCTSVYSDDNYDNTGLFSLHNKGVYFKMGLKKMMNSRTCKDLHRVIRVEMDGNLVELPPVEGIIVLNILRSVFNTFRSMSRK